jgi:flagellar motor switch protein FliM
VSQSGQAHLLGRSRRQKGSGPTSYDFRRPTKLSREHTRTLQVAYEAFARGFTTMLTSSLRVVSQVTMLSIEQLTYQEYIKSLSTPTVMAMVELEPLPGVAILEFSLTTAMACIDHMLGGPGGTQPERPLTDIETPLLHGLLDRALAELRIGYEAVADIQPRLLGLEYNPQFVQAAAASDAMIVTTFELRIGAEECLATFCLPFGPIFSRLQADRADVTVTPEQRTVHEHAHRNLVAGLERAPLEVVVRFASVRVRPEHLVDLQPGDVVPLAHPVTAPLTVEAAGSTFAYAVPGSQGTRLACLIVAPPEEDHNR